MEHNDAIRLMAAEKYLMGELTPDLRDSFEEHFFSCQDCAADVRAGAVFLEHRKKLLAVQPAREGMPAAPAPLKPGWLGWLRPALALPILGLLMGVILYQNLVTYPSLKSTVAELRTPQILPVASLISSNTRGGTVPSLKIRSGEPFLLFVDVPTDGRFSSYAAELHGPDGSREWSIQIPLQATRDTIPIRVPAGTKASGGYTLVVRGTGDTGASAEVGRYPFNLNVQ
jgi:hypothetical protein